MSRKPAELVQDLQRTCRLLVQFPDWGWPLKKRRKFPVGKYPGLFP